MSIGQKQTNFGNLTTNTSKWLVSTNVEKKMGHILTFVMLNKLSHPLIIVRLSDCFMQVVDINSPTDCQTVQFLISRLLSDCPALRCLQRWGISGLSRNRVNFRLRHIWIRAAGNFVVVCVKFSALLIILFLQWFQTSRSLILINVS